MDTPRFPDVTALDLLAKALIAEGPTPEAKCVVWQTWPHTLRWSATYSRQLERAQHVRQLRSIAEAWGYTEDEFDSTCEVAFIELVPVDKQLEYFR